MTTKDEALRLALEALESTVYWRKTGVGRPPEQTAIDAITACREALAQPAGESGELLPCPFCGHVGLDFHEGSTFRWLAAECQGCGASCGETRIQTIGEGTNEQWLEAAKANAIAAWNTRAALLSSDAQPSEWAGLSDDLIDEILEAEADKPDFKGSWSMYSFAHAIEAKLREKNAGKPAAADKAGGDEPVALPCCGYADGSAIKWNPYNGVVQCHNCGQVYIRPHPQADEPVAWRWPVKKLRGVEWRYSLRKTHQESEPLFTRPQPQADVPETNFGNMKGDKK